MRGLISCQYLPRIFILCLWFETSPISLGKVSHKARHIQDSTEYIYGWNYGGGNAVVVLVSQAREIEIRYFIFGCDWSVITSSK